MPKITLAVVRLMAQHSVVWDDTVKGFGARRRSGSAVSFFVKTRVKGRQRRITIGAFGSPWTPETARNEAEVILGKRHQGIDAGVEKKLQRQRGKLLREVLDAYMEECVKSLKPNTQDCYEVAVRKRLKPALGGKEMNEIGAEDVRKAHKGWMDSPRAANLAVAVLSAAFTWGGDNNYCEKGRNPCEGLERYPENERERFLTSDEAYRLAKVLAVAQEENWANPYIIAQIWLIIFTGARKNEISTLKWSYVDGWRAGLRLPDSKTGKKTVALSSYGVAVLEKIPRLGNSEYVFPNARGGALRSYWKVWNRIRIAAGIPDVRIHDLRHSFGGWAMDVGGTEPVLGRAIGNLTATRRYAHVKDGPVRQLVEATGGAIARAMKLSKTGKSLKARLRTRPLRPGRVIAPTAAE